MHFTLQLLSKPASQHFSKASQSTETLAHIYLELSPAPRGCVWPNFTGMVLIILPGT